MSSPRRIAVPLTTCLLLAALAAAALAAPAAADRSERREPPGELDLELDRPRPIPTDRFLEDAAPLLSEAEREAYAALEERYRKQAFIERFWRVRDPHPETARNELREDYELRLQVARDRFDDLAGDRPRALLLYGLPAEMEEARCSPLLRDLELWHYRGSAGSREGFTLVFYEVGGGWRLWRPRHGLDPLVLFDDPSADLGARRAGRRGEVTAERIARECFRGDRLLDALERTLDVEAVEEAGGPVPHPGEEWLSGFAAASTAVPESGESFPGSLEIAFPGRRQSRTVVQGVVAVPRREVEPLAGTSEPTYGFRVAGEVVLGDELFESFRYRFRVPAEKASAEVFPLVFERYLRPGAYRLLLRVEDAGSGRFFHAERELEVPSVTAPSPGTVGQVARARPGETGRADPSLTPPGGETGSGAPAASGTAAGTADVDPRTPALPDAAASTPAAPTGPLADLADLAEANATLAAAGDVSAEEATLRLLPPPPGLQTGATRVTARAEGAAIDRVRFLLDGTEMLSKRRPPWSVELDLGESPRMRRLQAVAVDEEGRELARDEILLNAGPHRFDVRLVEPEAGARYERSVRALAEVDVPEGERLDRVEMYLNEELVATLYQPPFAQPIVIPPGLDFAYVRSVAYLDDGNSTEDLVFVNAPEHLDEMDVQVVELYTTVVDRRGRPVQGLEADDFRVLEDGVAQRIRRFERVDDLPIYAGVVLDTSASMTEELHEAVEAALAFFETVIRAKDRAAVITFAEGHDLAVRFTNDREVLAGGLAAVEAEGETYLYDALVYSLYYFSGIRGKRALVLISDGDDVGSRYRFDDVLDYARRTGVALYTIGLGLPTNDKGVQLELRRLADETGGRAFFISSASGLGRVYETIEGELRSQYLLTYQAPSGDGTGGAREDDFREIEVEIVDRRGLEAKTLRGYYP